jgi:DnaJ-class molecular chaperone
MNYSQNVNKRTSASTPSSSVSHVNLAKQQGPSETLQDLIDILKQNYTSDCPHCSGTGINLKNHICDFCQGLGKSDR